MPKGDHWMIWLVLAVALLSLAALMRAWREIVPAASLVEDGRVDVVLDAGHGGEDGGAVSISGVPESGINLSVARSMEDVLSFFGCRCQMLRREDISLHDSTASTLREKKVSDLHNRAAIIERVSPQLSVSIHQNSYPKPQYHGAQVFYAPTPGSEEAALCLQERLNAALAPASARQAKQIPETVYLMNHISCPAVLVECGFLSNPEEEALLRDASYQRRLAVILSSAVLTVLEQH